MKLASLELRVVSSSPLLGMEPTLKKKKDAQVHQDHKSSGKCKSKPQRDPDGNTRRTGQGMDQLSPYAPQLGRGEGESHPVNNEFLETLNTVSSSDLPYTQDKRKPKFILTLT